MNKYTEILKLKQMLEVAKIPFEFGERYNGYHIKYPTLKDNICSVIEHDYSYGREEDLLEIMGLLTPDESKYDEVLGYLDANDVFNRISNHWNANKSEGDLNG